MLANKEWRHWYGNTTFGLALLTAKDADQSLCHHNFADGLIMKLWHLNRPTRAGEAGYKTKRDSKEKESNVHMSRDPGSLSEMEYRFSLFVGRCEKAGRSILLLTVPRPDVVLQMNTNNRHEPAKSWLQTAHDRLACSLGLPAVPWQEVLLWSWVNHHSPNRNYWCHGSTERKKNMLLHILF